uniref:DUF4806 domain-containing protein n=1 Tax=Anopheles culicifacies TaxID=139723 RepID=A0A182M4T8_9DIPT
MDRQNKKSVVKSQQDLEMEDHQDELDYDSEDVMIEFIKVECGRNPDADPFIGNVDMQEDEVLNEQDFPVVKMRPKKERSYHKTKLSYGNLLGRERKVPSTRAQAIPRSLKSKSIVTPTRSSTSTEGTTADQSLASLCTRTEQRLNNMEASLVEINDKLDSLGDQFQSILENVTLPPKKERTVVDIGFEKIDSFEQLERFNEDLSQPEYEEKIMQWLEGNIIDDRSDYRMTDAMDMLFTRKFLTYCSWTGIGKGSQKIAMMQMTNVTKLFQRIGTTLNVVVNHKRVAVFFMKKLKNACKRALSKGGRASVAPSATPSSLES